eukprot:jgi/Mesvir1/3659/Mv24046-RA.1
MGRPWTPMGPTTAVICMMGGQQNQNWYFNVLAHYSPEGGARSPWSGPFPTRTLRSEDADGAAFYSPNHRPDIVVLDFEGGGRHLLIVVSVAHPGLGALSHVVGASQAAGYTADRAERAKLERVITAYGDVRHHCVVPGFVLEEFGAMGTMTAGFFKVECCRLREDRLDLEGERAPRLVSADLDIVLAPTPFGIVYPIPGLWLTSCSAAHELT